MKPKMDVMIKTEQLGKSFDDFVAVDDVNLEVRSGQVLGLLGPNGAGKTTTVRMLSSILVPSRGRAWIAGHDVVRAPDQVRAAVGVLTENHGLYNRMFAAEYLGFFGEIYQLDAQTRKTRVEQLLGDFGLLGASKRRIGEYSKGMRQKLALARALLHHPQVLLLDEPTSAMDPESSRLVRDSIHALRSAERAIIICTHNLVEAEELADKIAIIRNGHIIAQGTPAELRRAYLGPAEFVVELGRSFPTSPELPQGARLVAFTPTKIQYATLEPQDVNPQVLRSLLDAGVPVLGLREVQRSLEEVYLKVMSQSQSQESQHA